MTRHEIIEKRKDELTKAHDAWEHAKYLYIQAFETDDPEPQADDVSRWKECPFCGPDGTAYQGDGETICKHCEGSHIIKPEPQADDVETIAEGDEEAGEANLRNSYARTKAMHSKNYASVGDADWDAAVLADEIAPATRCPTDALSAGKVEPSIRADEHRRTLEDFASYCHEAGHYDAKKAIEEYLEKLDE